MTKLVRHLVSLVSALVVIINLAICVIPLTLIAIVKALVPVAAVRRLCGVLLEWVYHLAAGVNSFWMTKVVGVRVMVEGALPDHPAPIVVCNHQSWFDIPIVHHVITGNGPIIKFLIKRELLWVPIIGWICYALDMPRLNRGKGMDAREKDYEAISRASKGLGEERGALLIFAEGTRFTEAKHDRQGSPYHRLLLPRPGGLKIALGNAREDTPVVDVTIRYDNGETNFWRCLHRACPVVTVRIEVTPAASIADPAEWLSTRWSEKDRFMAGTA